MTQCAVEFDVGIRFSVKAARGQQKTGSGRMNRLEHASCLAGSERENFIVLSHVGCQKEYNKYNQIGLTLKATHGKE